MRNLLISHRLLLFNQKVSLTDLKQKADGTKAVVAGYHSGLGIFHPAVVKIPATVGKRCGKRRKDLPRAVAKALGLLSFLTEKLRSHHHITSVLDWVFVFLYKIVVTRSSYDRYFYSFHQNVLRH